MTLVLTSSFVFCVLCFVFCVQPLLLCRFHVCTGNTTTIANPEDPEAKPRPFSFDYSYWSHDGGKELESGEFIAESDDVPYADQRMVFNDVGMGILANVRAAGYLPFTPSTSICGVCLCGCAGACVS